MISYRCDCGQLLKVKDEVAGQKVKCPSCDRMRRIPQTEVRAGSPRRDREDESAALDRDAGPPTRLEKSRGNVGLLIGAIAAGVLVIVASIVGVYLLLDIREPPIAKKTKDKKDQQPPPDKERPKEDPAARQVLENNLKQLGLAMHQFHTVNNRLPSPGFSSDPNKPLLSWRVAILPFVEEDALYQQFKLNEPWDSPHNNKLLARMPNIFQPVGGQAKKDGHTYLQLVTGPGTLYPAPTAAPNFASVKDGISNTILVVEAVEPVPWTKPADFTIDVSNVNEKAGFPKLGAFSSDGFFTCLCDGRVRFLSRSVVSARTVRLALNPADGRPMPKDWDTK